MTDPLHYVTEQQFRDYIEDDGTTSKDAILAAIGSASRSVDAHCSRIFFQQTTTQYFSADVRSPEGLWMLPLGDNDIATSAGLVVRTETGNDGTYPTTWTLGTDFILEPRNQSQGGLSPWPFTKLRAIGGKVWPVKFLAWQQDTIKIDATFGWPTPDGGAYIDSASNAPDAVKQATKIIANQLWKLGSAPFGVAGWGAFGDIRVKDIPPQAVALLQPYRKAESYGVA